MPAAIALAAIIILLVLAAIVLARTLAFSRTSPQKPTAPNLTVQAPEAASHLSAAVRCQTVSSFEPSPEADAAFEELHRFLKKAYPHVHKSLKLELVQNHSLLYTWAGTQPELPPVMLTAHQDVVPADPSSLDQWEHPPFDGVIADGCVWGRGTLDIKNQLIAIFEAVEGLLQAGYQPRRTLLLAFGHDEELGGPQGAHNIAATLAERGIRLEALLDEGMGIITSGLPGVTSPVALISNAEKGYLTLELKVESPPGHSAMPPRQTAIGILAAALTRLEAHPFPSHSSVLYTLFHAIGKRASFGLRLAFANLWLLDGIVRTVLGKIPETSAAIRTTTAVTLISGGIKDNILPREARAGVNFRLYPGDTIEKVVATVKRIIADERVQITVPSRGAWEATRACSVDTLAFQGVVDALHYVFGDVPAAPFLTLGATDARHYEKVSESALRFSPILVEPGDMARVHGINERIRVTALDKMVAFFAFLIQAWTDGGAGSG